MEPEMQKIVNRILKDAKEDAETILEEARKTAEATLEKQKELARQKAMTEAQALLRTSENKVSAIKETVFAETKRKSNWMILSEKEQAVNRVLEEVKARLDALVRSKEYVPVLERFIVNAGVVLGGGRLEFVLNEHDHALPLNSEALAKAITEKTGAKTQFVLSDERVQASGGAIVRREGGKILMDNTFESMLKRSEKNLQLRIAKTLFK